MARGSADFESSLHLFSKGFVQWWRMMHHARWGKRAKMRLDPQSKFDPRVRESDAISMPRFILRLASDHFGEHVCGSSMYYDLRTARFPLDRLVGRQAKNSYKRKVATDRLGDRHTYSAFAKPR